MSQGYRPDRVGDQIRQELSEMLSRGDIHDPGIGFITLTRVTMIGNDLQLDSGIGTCGKEGQSVPVGVGQPTLKIEGLTVGGTA